VKIAVIGSGIAGMVCARLLHDEHDITLFEANSYPGGHTNTVRCDVDGQSVTVDTGFIVFNDRTYPNFIGLLNELGVESRPTSMGFSVRCDRCGLEYNGSSLSGLFAQRRNLLRPSFHRMLADIVRFNRQAVSALDDLGEEMTVGRFLDVEGYSKGFAEHYLYPMGAAIWSCPMAAFEQFPIRFIIEFYRNHGLLDLRNRPTWKVIAGGSKRYVDRLLAPLRHRLRLNWPVGGIRRRDDGVEIRHPLGTESFDEVILACHSDQALAMLEDPSPLESATLNAFPYSRNTAVLHTDESLLPRRRSAWASWNYHIRAGEEARPAVTYNMNILQHIESARTICVTLNEDDAVAPESILRTFRYSHPVFTTRRAAAQRRRQELIRNRRTSYCGAYWGNGFHEDGVVSALAVCEAYGILPRWSVGPRRDAVESSDSQRPVARTLTEVAGRA
jgi:predicted NAD/FAD-binding protein